MEQIVNIVGAGLAGCEASWQLANRGIKVHLFEMKPKITNEPFLKKNLFAELVCSNSFRSNDSEHNAVGLLQDEMIKLDSLIMESALKHKVPAGGALAVDRDSFSAYITEKIKNHKNITIINEQVTKIENDNTNWIITTGPLTSGGLSDFIASITGSKNLQFFDAIAPIIYKESINFEKAWFQSRYDKGDSSDYINCPMNKEEYECFLQELLNAKYVDFHDWETPDTKFFEGCLPIEVMAKRGDKTLLFGPLKPVGLTNPHNPTIKPHAIIQLRQDNKTATLYNMVGFQTKMNHKEQLRILRLIPGLENATFARLGGIHRNTFINSPTLLNSNLTLKNQPNIRFAGQISGCEGYLESSSMGMISSLMLAQELLYDNKLQTPNTKTAIGSLLSHITINANKETFQPMNINFGLMDEITQRKENGRKYKGKERKFLYTTIAKQEINNWIEQNKHLFSL